MKRYFHQELQTLENDLVSMGQHALQSFDYAMGMVLQGELDLEGKLKESELKIDDLELKVDAEVSRYFSLRSPMASDVRLLMTAMKVSKSLERVGDEAISIAKRAKKIGETMPLNNLFGIPDMATLTRDLLEESNEVFLSLEKEMASKIPAKDKVIDQLNRDNFFAIEEFLRSKPASIISGMELLFISKSLERIADHAVNISSAVVFMVDAEDVRHTEQTSRSV